MFHRHFLSYSGADGLDFALRLRDILEAGPPLIPIWFNKRDLIPGRDWDEQLSAAIREAEGLFFAMTRDSVTANSECKREWTRALRYKKPIIPLLVQADAEMPYRLEPREWVDFSDSFESGLERLRQYVVWRRSPEGLLQTQRDRLADCERDLERAASPEKKKRIQEELEQLQNDLAEQERIVSDPESAARRVATSIAAGIERERTPQSAGALAKRTRFVNPPPGVAPTYFQDRLIETGLIASFLRDDARRVMMVIGRGGVGKTAMVCRLLKAVEGGVLPDDLGPFAVDGIVYLTARGTRRLNVPNLVSDLLTFLTPETAASLETLFKNPQASTELKVGELLRAIQNQRLVVLLDNFEDLIDTDTLDILDRELDDALRTLLMALPHGLKIIMTSRVAPRALSLIEPGRQARIDFDEGLDSPYAEQLLRGMDVDGKVGLRSAPDALLTKARVHTRGIPRALEALFAILSVDRDTTLEELLREDPASIGVRSSVDLPENVVEVLVGEAFARLDPNFQRVMQALAAYGHPVTPTAVDYLLQPFQLGVNSEPALNLLRNMHLVRKERGRYYLHPVDRRYVFERVPAGTASDRNDEPPPYTRVALLHRAADYFVQVRTPSDTWKTFEDVSLQIAEFDLRCEVGNYAAAVDVLASITYQLELWGNYAGHIALWARLAGRLGQSGVEAVIENQLGNLHYRVGQYHTALAHYATSLQHAQAAGDLASIGNAISGLGHCYGDLGWTQQAIECYERALAIVEADNPGSGVAEYGNIGFFAAELGNTRRAIEYHEKALEAYKRTNDEGGTAISRGNLGAQLAEIGDTTTAIAYCQQALAEAKRLGYRYAEAVNLTYLGDIFYDQGDWKGAIEHQRAAREVAASIGNVQFAVTVIHGLALAQLASGDVAAARATIDEGETYNVPRTTMHVLALSGVIKLAQAEQGKDVFEAALKAADEILTHTPDHSKAWDCKGLILAGLVLCEGDRHRDGAIAAYRRARALNREPGIVARVVGLFDMLARFDHDGVLAGIRKESAGQ